MSTKYHVTVSTIFLEDEPYETVVVNPPVIDEHFLTLIEGKKIKMIPIRTLRDVEVVPEETSDLIVPDGQLVLPDPM